MYTYITIVGYGTKLIYTDITTVGYGTKLMYTDTTTGIWYQVNVHWYYHWDMVPS